MSGAAPQADKPGIAAPGMALVQRALSLYRRRHFTECAELCEQDSSSKQLQWLGMLALTQHAWLDELELEGLQSLAEELLDNQATAQTGRPGTSLRAPPPPTGGGRPMTREGRPLTGLRRRPRSRTATQQGVERALYTSAGRTARPTTAAPAVVPEFGRLGAAASGWPDKPWLSKPLFRFLYHQRGDVRQALQLASQERSTDCCGWWSLQRGRCLLRLGMLREAEQQFRKAAEAGDPQPRTFLWLAKVQLQMDQPLAAVEAYRRGLDRFPNEASLVAPMARVYEGLHDLQRSAKLYRELLSQDAVHVEAIACVATHHFYADQPEMALRFYRRLLQLGMPTAELYNNLALCCFYAQQYDMALTCFDRALALAEDQLLADVWYNLGLVALSSGDKTLATRAFRLALVYDNCHAESYNNLGVLELTSGNVDQAAAYFATAGEMAPELCEAQYNRALVLERTGDLQGCARAASKCSQHAPSADLLQKVQAFFQSH
ncbi:tetratricopeptide repeat protein 8 isoform X2 [Rhipicephalus sanguineus]|uniref:tetratricopeptide repeat protein 8 isoform X2 n=1 Tax=Rhipicephalus sanguineus TaxID=34632 RepID=UPI0018947E9A|nr:tetratricopeptide repeat protein 8 isoform X2 [Rhipicephalus sanguineus]